MRACRVVGSSSRTETKDINIPVVTGSLASVPVSAHEVVDTVFVTLDVRVWRVVGKPLRTVTEDAVLTVVARAGFEDEVVANTVDKLEV